MDLTYEYLLNELDRGELPQDIAKRFHTTNADVLRQIEEHELTDHIIYNKTMSTTDRTYLNTLETTYPSPQMIRGTYLSDPFLIDSTGVVDVTIAHGLGGATITTDQCNLSIVKNTAVYDYVAIPVVVSIDALNVNIKVNVFAASSTAAATAKIGLVIV